MLVSSVVSEEYHLVNALTDIFSAVSGDWFSST